MSETYSFATLGYRKLDTLGDAIDYSAVVGRGGPARPGDTNLYVLRGDGDRRFEPGETAYKLSDMVQNHATGLGGTGPSSPVRVTANGLTSDFLFQRDWGDLTSEVRFGDHGFGVASGWEWGLNKWSESLTNTGESLTFTTSDRMSNISFTVDLPWFWRGTTAQVLIDLDGDVMHGNFALHSMLQFPNVLDGDRFTFDFDQQTISKNGVVFASAALGAVFPFFHASETSGDKNITIGTGTYTGFTLRDVVIETGRAPDPGNIQPIYDLDDTPNKITDTAAPGTAIGLTLRAIDPDETDTVTYSLSDGRFSVGQDGVVHVGNGTFNSQTEPEIQLGITASSTDGSSTSTSFTIDVIPDLLV